jgi:hypothetical protein
MGTADIRSHDGRGEWWMDHHEVIAFARALVETDRLVVASIASSITSASRSDGPMHIESGARWAGLMGPGTHGLTS